MGVTHFHSQVIICKTKTKTKTKTKGKYALMERCDPNSMGVTINSKTHTKTKTQTETKTKTHRKTKRGYTFGVTPFHS